MKKKILINLALVSINLAFVLGFTFIAPLNKSVASTLSNDSQKALELVNETRVKNGLNELNWDEKLSSAASAKAADIVEKNYFDHVSPDGKKAWDFVLESGYNYRFAGENLAIDFTNVSDAEIAWEKSPSHLKNILSENFDEFGFAEIEGVVNGQNSQVYVQIFGNDNTIYERIL